MSAPLTPQAAFAQQLEAHRVWLAPYPGHLKKWTALLALQPESAIVEALVRGLLAPHVDGIAPGEDLKLGGPDFRCTKSSVEFFVEAKALESDATEKRTGLPKHIDDGVGSYHPFDTEKIYAAAEEKVRRGTRAPPRTIPTLVAIGTLHALAGDVLLDRVCVEIACAPGVSDSHRVDHGYMELAPDSRSLVLAKDSESGLLGYSLVQTSAYLFMALGQTEPTILGALHPGAELPFDRELLRCFPFLAITLSESRRSFRLDWI